MERWSARRWIARILITWGAVTILVAAVHTPRQFYAARFLLGVAEAGFFPGLLVYLTHWFRHEDSRQSRGDVHGRDTHVEHSGRAVRGVDPERALAGMAGMEMAIRGGGPSRGFIWRGDSVVSDGLAGGGEVAAAGREGMAERRVRREKEAKARALPCTVWQALRRPEVALLTLVYFLAIIGIYGFIIWFPTIVKRATGLPNGK